MSYGSKRYWEDRYAEGGDKCEWYYSFDVLLPILQEAGLTQDSSLLEIGCGDAPLLTSLSGSTGIGRLVCCDYSAEVVDNLIASQQQQAQQSAQSGSRQVEFVQMDARSMGAVATASMDLVVDKGTIDAVLCGRGGRRNLQRILAEVLRVLRSPGAFVLVSHMEFASGEMQDILHSVLLPLLDADRTLQWALKVFATDAEGMGTVYLLTSRPRRRTRHMLSSPAPLPIKLSTFGL